MEAAAVLAIARALSKERYSGAAVVFAAGSLVRGEGTPFSDLDLVVVYPRVPAAFRESFTAQGVPVEAFVHDPDTLEYFSVQVDCASGTPLLPHMVAEGVEVPAPCSLSQTLKARAVELLDAGPPPLDGETERRRRYFLTDLLDDLRGARLRPERVATAASLYHDLADYLLRSRGLWSAKGKGIPRALARADAKLSERYDEAFDALFHRNTIEPVIQLVEEVLSPHGGLLFDGYRSEAPALWRAKPRRRDGDE
jgi:Nucleotidyltransferase domain